MRNEKSRKLPAFQVYGGDWRKDPGVQSLNYHDRGVWWEILLLMHESDERGVLLLNGKPMPIEALGRLLGLDNQILTTTLTTLLDFGVASKREDGAIYNRRMVRDEQIRQERIKAGYMGGNPNLLKQKSTSQVNQKSTPSSSISYSSSDIFLAKHSSLISKLGNAAAVQALEAWIRYKCDERKEKLTRSGIFQVLKRYEGKSAELINDIKFSIASELSAIRTEWKKKEPTGRVQPEPYRPKNTRSAAEPQKAGLILQSLGVLKK